MKKLIHTIIVISILTGCAQQKETQEIPAVPEGPLADLYDPSLYPFYHNVASGDPLENSVIIWTRVHPEDPNTNEEVQWQVAKDEQFAEIIKEGQAFTNNTKDFTLKVNVQDLQPGTTYFYRFENKGRFSPVGRTKTLPSGTVDQAKFAVVSCSNWEFGYFNSYGHIADRDDLDAVLHLGDYIYEYGAGTYGDTTTGRFHVPDHEIITLEDYRMRYSQYRLDPNLQKVHQQHPFIVVWDDHEIANDAYKTGAQNHQPEEGSYEERKEIARRVYYNWMPVRDDEKLYRSFQFGDLAQLLMLDERLEGRTEPPADTTSLAQLPENHTMLGNEQLSWFLNELGKNEEKWQVVGNQVIFSYLNYGRPDFNLNMDSWDGYPVERQTITNYLEDNAIENVIFVTGDTHSGWAFEVVTNPLLGYDSLSGIGAFAVEFGTTSVSSGNADERYDTDTVKMHEDLVLKPLNPHLKYVNMRDHGYLLLTLNRDEAKAEWYVISTLKDPRSTERLDASAKVAHGTHRVEME